MVSLVIFEGGQAASSVERMLAAVRRAVVVDTTRRALGCGAIDRVIVATDSEELAASVRAAGAEVDWDGGQPSFHFGKRLGEIIERRRLDRVIYMSGGLGALATPDDLAWVARELARHDRVVIANNVHSADLVAFTPASAIRGIDLPAMDNSLAMALNLDAGLPLAHPPRTLGLHFDIDTPVDLLALSIHPGTGPETRRALEAQPLDLRRVKAVMGVMDDPAADLLIFGRIGSPLFHYLDDRTRCRLRVFSEERGMKSLGRDVRGEVVSLIGFLWESVGSRGLFERIARIASAALLDTRVLFAHRRWALTQAERFWSDVGAWEEIRHPGLREFTRAAQEATIPTLLGGHSLVSGGVWALVDARLRGVGGAR
ncbi:MAG: hypothetical protein IMX02_08070 [Limnochordaceae bacterium]|uniref:Uncharacterized protein n=1 Tax=Carboxydichorda subterranea TaxID=3109565 RepID=A0ABZ1BYW8_9FIRM|nr:hypothetical protein [Limnochorda sp. L945t]MBE3598737.1 hypothetical protein [Limnochordaceae bacterium]WRP17996.1 hypothetical protein U7230_03010 [Limnochorda sp. L945t]